MSLSYRQMKKYTEAELLRLYKDADPEWIEERRMALIKMRGSTVDEITRQRREAIEQGGTIKTAMEQQRNAIEVELIKWAKEHDVAQIYGEAEIRAASMEVVAKAWDSLGATPAVQAKVNNSRKAMADQGRKLATAFAKEVATADTDQSAEQLLANSTSLTSEIQNGLVAYDEELKAMNQPEERYMAKRLFKEDFQGNMASAISQATNDKGEQVVTYAEAADYIEKVLSNKDELRVDKGEQAAHDNVREVSSAVVLKTLNKYVPGVDKNIIDKIVADAADPSKTIAEYVKDLDKIPPDPQAAAHLKLLDKEREKLDTPQRTQFGQFYKLYEDHPEKDALNRIIGVTDDKNAAFIYNYNNDMLQSALAGIGMKPGEERNDADITVIRNKIAKELGMNFIGDIHPVRLRQAMSRRTPLEIPSTEAAAGEPPDDLEQKPPTPEELKIAQEISGALDYDEIPRDARVQAQLDEQAKQAGRAAAYGEERSYDEIQDEAIQAAEEALGAGTANVEDVKADLMARGVPESSAEQLAQQVVLAGQAGMETQVSPEEVGPGGVSDTTPTLEEQRQAKVEKREKNLARIQEINDEREQFEKEIAQIKEQVTAMTSVGFQEGKAKAERLKFIEENEKKLQARDSRVETFKDPQGRLKPGLNYSVKDENEYNQEQYNFIKEFKQKYGTGVDQMGRPTGTTVLTDVHTFSPPASARPPTSEQPAKTTPFAPESEQSTTLEDTLTRSSYDEYTGPNTVDTPVIMTDVIKRIAADKKKKKPNEILAEYYSGGSN